jgi:hypothetical protein
MVTTKRLGAAIAREAQIRKGVMRKLTDAYHGLSHPDLLVGIVGTYKPRADEGEPLPPEGKRVQATVEEMIAKTREHLVEMYNATAARDYTNASGSAHADVVVAGTVLIPKAPVPYLLWLDKQLDELLAFANRIPTLTADSTWDIDEAHRGTYVSNPVVTARQVPLPTVVTLSPATDKHPANAQVHAIPTTVGDWTRRKYSGGVPVERKETILHRLNQLKEAVAVARAEANGVEAIEPAIGTTVMDFIFAGGPGE